MSEKEISDSLKQVDATSRESETIDSIVKRVEEAILSGRADREFEAGREVRGAAARRLREAERVIREVLDRQVDI